MAQQNICSFHFGCQCSSVYCLDAKVSRPSVEGLTHRSWCLQWKVAPALAAGNCIVLKPSEVASLTCLELGALAVEAGLPAGVLNVITGLGADCGGPLRYILRLGQSCMNGQKFELLHVSGSVLM